MMKAAANTILGPRLRRKSTALLMTNELRRNSRVSTCSFEQIQMNHILGPDGLTFYGVNLIPFANGGFRYNLSGVGNPSVSSRKASLFLGGQLGAEQKQQRKKTRLQRVSDILLSIYDRSRIHYVLPILILIAYSFLGGFIFYVIESNAEQDMLLRKKEYVEREEGHILTEVLDVERRIREMHHHYNASSQSRNAELMETYATISTLNKEIRKYKRFAVNRLSKVVYWYVLQVYYLTDQETYKSSLLHPSNPERHWRSHYQSSGIGRIVALRNYTDQLVERCWELGVELDLSEQEVQTRLRVSIQEFNYLVGLQHTLAPTWTFWNSMFLAVTTYSTIGYGNITPKTNQGKLAAMIYAAIGIPMTFMVLHKLGRFFLLCLEHFWNKLLWLMEFLSCVKNTEKLKGNVHGGAGRMPILLLVIAIGVAFSWMFLCAAIFLKFEKDWDYFKSFYFFFCSLTTIGYGDVTPTNSEDMFIIFGFIIVGLSLVSMCINLIQLKLEELFEELLMTLLEEYREAGQTVEEITATMKPKMSLMDLWKVWKRRKHRRSMMEQQNDFVETEEIPISLADHHQPHHHHQHQMIDTIIPPATVSPSREWPAALSENNFRRVIKMFPFGRRRREAILRRLQLRMNQHSKGCQTDLCCVHGFRYHPRDMQLLNYTTKELDEEETLTNNSSELSSSLQHVIHLQESNPTRKVPIGAVGNVPYTNRSGGNSNESAGSSSSNKNLRVNASSSMSSSPVALTISSSTSTSSPYIRRYLPSSSHQQNHHHHHHNRRMTASSAQTQCSAQSTPLPNSAGYWEQHGGKRRWTFFESAKTPRGAPRGLAVPYMYTRRMAKTHETSEMRRLIAEIDSRLLDCRTLVSPCSRSISRTSTATSPSIPSNRLVPEKRNDFPPL